MNLRSIEPTPSPNTMKLNLDTALPPGERRTYTPEHRDAAPPLIRRILAVPGVKSVFHTADFLAVDRHPNGDWQEILARIREAFGAGDADAPMVAGETEPDGAWGEAQVFLQTFRGIPLQVRVRSGGREVRGAMPERFAQAALQAGSASPTLLKERKLDFWRARYGEPETIVSEVTEEIDAAYGDERLARLVELASRQVPEPEPARKPLTPEETERALSDPDWKTRYAALLRLKPDPERLDLLERALRDEQVSISRLAAVYLGDIRTPEAMNLLFRALKDPSPAVRRTAGDTLSDLGDPAAIGPMTEALRDPNKLVRWRAARFLYEVGDESAADALREAAAVEPEFEVRLQIQMAIERIERGEAAVGTVWQQMTNRNRLDPSDS